MAISEDLIRKAKATKSVEELMAFAKENNWELTEEEAAAYFAQLHIPSGELDDDELENVAGGRCYNGGKPVMTVTSACDQWSCPDGGGGIKWYPNGAGYLHDCAKSGKKEYPGLGFVCGNCKYLNYTKALWLCENPKRRK